MHHLIKIALAAMLCLSFSEEQIINTNSSTCGECEAMFLKHKDAIYFDSSKDLITHFKEITGLYIHDYMSCVVQLADAENNEAMDFFKSYSRTLLQNVMPTHEQAVNTIAIATILAKAIGEMKSKEGFELGLDYFEANICMDDLKGHPRVNWRDYSIHHRAGKNYSGQSLHSILLKKMAPANRIKYHEIYFELYIKHAQDPEDNCVKGWVVEMSKILFEDYKNGEIELIEID